MDLGNQIILIGTALVVLSIFAGFVSARIGAPVLLVFLALGMLAGEDGPGGILFDDFRLAYIVGSVSLAIILFDGGLRTKRSSFRIALWPSLVLATVGVVLTAGIVAVAAVWLLGFGWLEGMLIGAIVGSTDAAAVFFLLHLHGLGLQQRVSATLELESGMNDPMAIFLTVACIELLHAGEAAPTWATLIDLVRQLGGGAAVGFGGGYILLWLVRRLKIASGLYPILAVSVALFFFAAAQLVDASGYMAIYIVGLILGNTRHPAAEIINRFHDGLAWLSQIVMFLMLGLLVTPSRLLPEIWPALLIAAVLMFLARPVAIGLCIWPFRFTWREIAFVSWVGLRGAVPIFLATLPLLAGLPGGRAYFDIAFVVVLASLVLQGWTVPLIARTLGLDLPSQAVLPERAALDVPQTIDRDIAGFTLGSRSAAAQHAYGELPLPNRTRVLSVIRQGTVLDRAQVERLQAGDYVLAVAPAAEMEKLERLFATREGADPIGVFGEFVLDGAAAVAAVNDLYGLGLSPEEAVGDLAGFLRRRLGRTPVVGDRVRVGEVELVVREMTDSRVLKAGLEVAPGERPRRGLAALPGLLRRWRARLGRGARAGGR